VLWAGGAIILSSYSTILNFYLGSWSGSVPLTSRMPGRTRLMSHDVVHVAGAEAFTVTVPEATTATAHHS
jgi:hypothetical protein